MSDNENQGKQWYKEMLSHEVKFKNREKNIHWINKQGFQKNSEQNIEGYLYEVNFQKQNCVSILLPQFQFTNFDFYCYTNEKQNKEKVIITFIRKELFTLDQFKQIYNFHIKLYNLLKGYQSSKIDLSEFLKFDQLFQETKYMNCLIPLGLVLPIKQTIINFDMISKVNNSQKNLNIQVNDIIILNLKKPQLFKVIKKIDNFTKISLNEFVQLCKELVQSNDSNYETDFYSKFQFKKKQSSKNFFELIQQGEIKHELRNYISKEFIQDCQQQKSEQIYLLIPILGCQSFKLLSKDKEQKIIGNIQNIIPRICFQNAEYLNKFIIDEEQLFQWLKIPSLISYFVFHSKIITFTNIYEIYPKQSYTKFIEAFTVKKKDQNYNLESLETIGDSILKIITAFYIYIVHEDCDEGQMSEIKGKLISNFYYQYQAILLGIPQFLIVDNNINVNYFIHNDQYLKKVYIKDLKRKYFCDAFEALMAAFYFDKQTLYPLYSFLINFTNCFLQNLRNYNMIYSSQLKKQSSKVKLENQFNQKFLNTDKKIQYFEGIFLQPHYWCHQEIIKFKKDSTLMELLQETNLLQRYENFIDSQKNLENFQIYIDYKFKDINLLKNVMKIECKEFQRLEFFGDNCMEYFILSFFGNYYSKYDLKTSISPGFLYKIKCYFVSNMAMLFFVNLFKLNSCIICDGYYVQQNFNQGLENIDLNMKIKDFMQNYHMQKMKDKQKIQADIWESFIAAIILDGGIMEFNRVIGQFMQGFLSFFVQYNVDLKMKDPTFRAKQLYIKNYIKINQNQI